MKIVYLLLALVVAASAATKTNTLPPTPKVTFSFMNLEVPKSYVTLTSVHRLEVATSVDGPWASCSKFVAPTVTNPPASMFQRGFVSVDYTNSVSSLTTNGMLICAPNGPDMELSWAPAILDDPWTFVVYMGAGPGLYLTNWSTGKLRSCTVSKLIPGRTYCFVVAAHDTMSGLSPFSTEASYVVASSTNAITLTYGSVYVPTLRATNWTVYRQGKVKYMLKEPVVFRSRVELYLKQFSYGK